MSRAIELLRDIKVVPADDDEGGNPCCVMRISDYVKIDQAIAELQTMPNKKAKPHREICALCHEVSRVGFYVPDEIWQAAVHKHYQNSIVCLRCFTRLADEKSVEWNKEIKFYPVSRITHSAMLALSVGSQ